MPKRYIKSKGENNTKKIAASLFIDRPLPTSVSGLLSCLWRVCYQRGLPRLVFTSW